jgi:dipeptidyl aminopeptidase/acylaminoacyl peptidase
LGGSYSALHVLRILEREGGASGLRAALLLGSPADLFDMRRRYEDGTFIPPFGLDQALVALGLPDRAPLRYWRYSGAYHVRPDFPPVLLLHSRDDPVVPYQQSEQLAAALAAAGVPHDLHVFATAGHYLLSEGGEAEAIYRLSLDFLESRLRS